MNVLDLFVLFVGIVMDMLAWLIDHPAIAILIIVFLFFGFLLPKDHYDNSNRSSWR